jgi:hypothetical protein
MVYVRLARGWTDAGGADHGAGDLVDVDAITLAELEADGVVAAADGEPESWPGPTSPDPGQPDDPAVPWPGPTSPDPGKPQPWPGPTGEPEKARA